MILSDLLKLHSVEGQFLHYLIEKYSSKVITPYVDYYHNRESRLKILLSDNEGEYNRIKNSVDVAMDNVNVFVDSLDLNNLDGKELDKFGSMIEELAKYMSYTQETIRLRENGSSEFAS